MADLEFIKGAMEAAPADTVPDNEFSLTELPPDRLKLGSPEFEGMIGEINNNLRGLGWNEEQIARVNGPLGKEAFEVMNDRELYDQLRQAAYPVMRDNRDLIQDEADMVAQYMEENNLDGLNQFEWSAIRDHVSQFQAKIGVPAGQVKKRINRLHRGLAEEAVSMVENPFVEIEAGLLLLDGARWLDAKWKLLWTNEQRKEDIIQQVLPTVTFEDPTRPSEEAQEHANGFTAGFQVLKRNAALRASEAGGIIMRDVGQLLKNMSTGQIKEWAEQLEGKGQVQAENAAQGQRNLKAAARQTIALTGKPLEWYQVLESYTPEEGVEEWYSDQAKAGPLGTANLALMATGSGVAEFLIDPLWAVGVVGKGVLAAARKVGVRVAPQAAMNVAAEVATKTMKLEDVSVARQMAEDIFEKINTEHLMEPTLDSAKRVVSAWDQMQEWKGIEAKFADAGPNEAILIRTPERKPDTINPRETMVYVEQDVPNGRKVGADYDRSINEIVTRHGQVMQDLDGIPETRTNPRWARIRQGMVELQQEFHDVATVVEGGVIKGRSMVANPTERRTRLDKIQMKIRKQRKKMDEFKDPKIIDNPEYVRARTRMHAMEAEFDDLVRQQQALDDLVIEHGPRIQTARRGRKNTNVLAEELHQARKLSLERSSIEPIDWDKYDDLPLFEQRQVLGPDDVEQNARVLEHMVHSGGTGIDDITTTTRISDPMPEYNVGLSSGNQDAHIDWTRIDRANDITKLEREFMSTSGGRQLNLFESDKDTLKRGGEVAGLLRRKLSTQRLAMRQQALANKKGGRIRNAYDENMRKMAAYYQEQAKVLRKAADEAANAPKDWWAEIEGDGATWLGGHSTPLLKDPERLQKWLAAGGYRLHRSLYPGGVAMNTMEIITGAENATGKLGKWSRTQRQSMGQRLSLFREPHRFFAHYAPREWQEIRAGYENYHRASTRDFDRFIHLGERAGIVVKKEGIKKKLAHTDWYVDKKRSEQAFDILNINRSTEVGMEEFEAAFAKADPQMQEFVAETQKWLDHAADLQGISGTDRYITGYITHVWKRKDFANGARPLEYIGLPANANTWVAHLLDRTGGKGGYVKDVMLALDFYTRGVNRKLYLEPVYDRIIQTGRRLAYNHQNPAFLSYANSLVAEMKGQPTVLGKKIDEFIGKGFNGRPVQNATDRALTGLTTAWWASALPGNPRYPIMQVATAVATTSGRFGLYRTMKGLLSQATVEGRALAKAAGVEREIKQVFESDIFRKLSEFVSRAPLTISPMGLTSTQGVENFIRGMTFHASLDQQLTKMGFATWQEAKAAGFAERVMFEALRASEEVNHVFGAMGRSPWATRYSSRGVAAATTQFLGFVPKQLEELAAQAWRDPGAIAEYMAISGYISLIAAEEMGVDMTDYVGLGFVPNTAREMQSPFVQTLMAGVDYMAAWSEYDKDGMNQAGTLLVKNATTMLPLAVGFNAAVKGWERIQTGELTSQLGKKERNLEFSQISSERPNPALGSDLYPTITGQQSIRDRMYYQAKRRTTRKAQNLRAEITADIRSAVDMLEDKNVQGFDDKVQEIFAKYGMGAPSADRYINEYMTREISWFLRTVPDADANLILDMIEEMTNAGVRMEP